MKTTQAWKGYEKILFRTALIYFFIQAFPLDWKYYKTVVSINWLAPHFQELFRLTTYMPSFISPGSIWGIESFVNWLVILIIAIAGSAVWSIADKKSTDYNQLYYWLRVLLRYRLAVGIIGYGVLKLFKLQLPEPTLSDLHTSYGDYLPWKIYALSTGIGSAFYEQSIGLIEIIGAVLLLFRRTATIGASVIIFVLTNIVIANFAYEIGEHVYSAYLLSIALFLLAYDLPRLYSVFVKRQLTRAAGFKPVIVQNWLRTFRIVLKSSVALFFLFYGVKTYAGLADNWPFPTEAGLSNAYGFYNVSEFRINNREIPYSLTDSLRWNNVVFEKWNTISIRTNRSAKIDFSGTTVDYALERNYESAGNAGRHFYAYQADTVSKQIELFGKNDKTEKLHFHYARPDVSTIILSGTDADKDSVRIVLTKVDKKYLLKEGRRKPIKIN
ncbi:DoxX family protein [Dyadobacter diqingensis]|uniref:DoxX family protein n=1 Tax=Dyadobacter diqingensis TaxID=2938121 RepID=UPI0020C18EFF|nr:DoxX family protein [Dyadobacter diqingensis]